jgi:hypothetical protein
MAPRDTIGKSIPRLAKGNKRLSYSSIMFIGMALFAMFHRFLGMLHGFAQEAIEHGKAGHAAASASGNYFTSDLGIGAANMGRFDFMERMARAGPARLGSFRQGSFQ